MLVAWLCDGRNNGVRSRRLSLSVVRPHAQLTGVRQGWSTGPALTQRCVCCAQGQKGALSGELVADAVTNGDYSRLALGVRAPLRVQQLASGQYRGVCEPPVRRSCS